jgi:glyoxalase family protein
MDTPLPASLPGLHHVTAICRDPQVNHAFYVGLLGLRLVKRTVNFDDPSSYHLYYGDGAGTPGSVLTFFCWGPLAAGRRGHGQALAVAFAIAPEALEYWRDRLRAYGVKVEGLSRRFGDEGLEFSDPDGLKIELVTTPASGSAFVPWENSPVPAAMQLRGLRGVSLGASEATDRVEWWAETLGWRAGPVAEGRQRVLAPLGAPHSELDLVHEPGGAAARQGTGTVHHVALRVKDEATQRQWREGLIAKGYAVSPVMDRSYFRSIYFRAPGGVLLEIATDAPGFAVDEVPEELGQTLKLPPQFEARRAEVLAGLAPLD